MLLSYLQCLFYIPQELKNRLKSADYQEKIYLVKMIGNFGHRSLYQPLLDIIKNTTNTLELRVTAVYALRRIAPRIPQKVITINSKPVLCLKRQSSTSVLSLRLSFMVDPNSVNSIFFTLFLFLLDKFQSVNPLLKYTDSLMISYVPDFIV